MADWNDVSDFIQSYAKQQSDIPEAAAIKRALPNCNESVIAKAVELIDEQKKYRPTHVVVEGLANFGLGGELDWDPAVEQETHEKLRDRSEFERRSNKMRALMDRLSDSGPEPDDTA